MLEHCLLLGDPPVERGGGDDACEDARRRDADRDRGDQAGCGAGEAT